MSDVKSVTFCDECEHRPCLFEAFREGFIATESWMAKRDLIKSRIKPGNLCQRALRKKLFTSFTRFNCAVGNREKNPSCVETGIRKLVPSSFYMGFKRTRDNKDNHAVDINGNKVDGAKWVRTETGKYELKLEEEVLVADNVWKKRCKGSVED